MGVCVEDFNEIQCHPGLTALSAAEGQFIDTLKTELNLETLGDP
jgi:hypothetical protein